MKKLFESVHGLQFCFSDALPVTQAGRFCRADVRARHEGCALAWSKVNRGVILGGSSQEAGQPQQKFRQVEKASGAIRDRRRYTNHIKIKWTLD